jgi:hypothetical protein
MKRIVGSSHRANRRKRVSAAAFGSELRVSAAHRDPENEPQPPVRDRSRLSNVRKAWYSLVGATDGDRLGSLPACIEEISHEAINLLGSVHWALLLARQRQRADLHA